MLNLSQQVAHEVHIAIEMCVAFYRHQELLYGYMPPYVDVPVERKRWLYMTVRLGSFAAHRIVSKQQAGIYFKRVM